MQRSADARRHDLLDHGRIERCGGITADDHGLIEYVEDPIASRAHVAGRHGRSNRCR